MRRFTSVCLITVSRPQARLFSASEGFDDLLFPLTKTGIDDALAKHIAHLFIRDPLVVFSERVDQDDETSMDHFENIQSTNWQTMRFKPPPVDSPIGWRVEFRSMEVQLTDFENAAYSVFIVLLTRAILSFNLNFYMPISKVRDLGFCHDSSRLIADMFLPVVPLQVDINMQRAQKRDAARSERFHFRKWVFPLGRSPSHDDWSSRPSSPSRAGFNGEGQGEGTTTNGTASRSSSPGSSGSNQNGDSRTPGEEVEEMTVDEIINGKVSLIPA
jgi:glutamate--cysteine ligase catalytic subunit